MRFKKLVSGAAALAVAASAFAGLSIMAGAEAKNLYTQDFEGKELADLSYTLAGNTTARMLTNVSGNSSTFFNYYVDGGSGNRASSLSLEGSYGAGVPVRLSILVKMMGSNTNPGSFQLQDSSGTAIFTFDANSYMGSPTINGQSVSLTTSKGSGLGVSDYAATGWLKFDADVDFRTSPSIVDLTVTDITNGNAVVYDAKTTTLATDVSTVYGSIGRANGAFAFDDIVIDEIDPSDLDQSAAYTITYDVDGVETNEIVNENEFVAHIPETSKTGYIFKGWRLNDTDEIISTEALSAAAVTSDAKYTAVYEADASYIEPITSISFKTYPTGNLLVPGEDENTPADNLFELMLTGELGTDIAENPDERVNDFNITYEIKGFNWKSHDRQPTDDSADWPYCDSYGRFTYEGPTANFQLKKHPFNYYGQITAAVTYNGETKSVSLPLAYIGNPEANTDNQQILPRGGYYEDFNSYSPDMVGYQTVVSGDNKGAVDVVTDNWASYGGNARTVTITEEEGNKFLRLEATGTKSSSFIANQITAVKDQQIVSEQTVRFHNAGSSILLKTANPVTWTTGAATTYSVNFTGSALNINGNAICDAATGIWYRIVITSDVTSGKCYAEVYSETGEKLGASEVVNFSDAGSTNPVFYCFRTPDNAPGKIDINKVKITRAAIDESSIKTTATSDTISVPEAGKPAVSETLTISAQTTEGLPAIGKAEWIIADETISGVTVTPSADDSHTATVTVAEGATPGEMPITVTLGGKTAQMNITLSSSQDSVKFTESTTSVSIPLNENDTKAYSYRAIVVDGNGNEIAGKDITYALYDSKNVNPISAPSGMTFENGVLTVTSAAKAASLYVRAISTNTNNETITKAVKVDIHGLAFDFGAGTDEDIADGYTSVTPASAYSEKVGYGIDGTATAGGEASIEDAAKDYLEGVYTFKADVAKGKYYTVDVTYKGTLKTAYINSDLAAYTLGTNDSMTTASYTVPATRSYIDLLIDGQIAAVILTQQEDRTPGAKPSIYHVGDSTSANNGSWAYTIDHNRSNYPELDALATFYNSGAGGRNLGSYYTEGKLGSVLNNLRPGDIVMFGNNGTNGMGSSFEEDANYYLDAAETMGAQIIINSYTPHGAVAGYASGYDSASNTFNSWRQDSYDVIIRSIAEERATSDPNYLGFVEIGKNADAAFNAYVADYAANGYDSADAAAQAIISCFGDHNHYSDGTIARDLMLNGYGDVKGIVSQIVSILNGETPGPTLAPTDAPTETSPPEQPTPEVPTPTIPPEQPSSKPTIAFDKDAFESGTITVTTSNTEEGDDVYIAQYDGDGHLIGLVKSAPGSIGVEIKTDTTKLKAFIWSNIYPRTNAEELEKK